MRCELCGIYYFPDDRPDAARHRRTHNEFLNGAPMKPAKLDHVLCEDSSLRITIAGPASPLGARQRIARIARLANGEMQYDFGIYSAWEDTSADLQVHGLIGFREGRAVALVLMERRDSVWTAEWAADGTVRGAVAVPGARPRWTVGFAWTVARFRRQGIVRRMIEEAARFLGTGTGELAWYTPFSPDGARLARSFCPGSFIIAK